jgi:NAD(P) transhydrogenase subunit alpha
VVVDLAGETGGNCELTEPGRTVVKHDVTIASPLNLPATMPEHASELYSKNITALLDLLITDGTLAPDFEDEVVAGACVTRAGDGAVHRSSGASAEERRNQTEEDS